MLADFHTHSPFSADSKPGNDIDKMCEAAIERGLSYLAITDHHEVGGPYGDGWQLDLEAVFRGMSEVKEKYAGRLTVLCGIEIGQGAQAPEKAAAAIAACPFDIVLNSMHALRGEGDFYHFDFTDMPQDEINAWYDRSLDEHFEMLDIEGTHVLTHLTYMHRYVRRCGRDMSFTPFLEKAEALFQKMIQKNVALEVNTSSLGSGTPVPVPEFLKLYHDVGGRLLSLGSDAHHYERIAADFDLAAAMLRDCGFKEIATPTRNGILTFPI